MARKKKITDINQAAWGSEPEWQNHKQTNQYTVELSKALTWYRNMVKESDTKRWLVEWAKNTDQCGYSVEDVQLIPDSFTATSGAFARIIMRGFDAREADIVRLNDRIGTFIKYAKTKKAEEPETKSPMAYVKLIPYYNMFDEFVDGGINSLSDLGINLTKANIAEMLYVYQEQLDDVLQNKDEYLPNERPILIQRFSAVVDFLKQKNVVKKITRTRKKRAVTKDKLVSKIKYQPDFAELNLISINPEKIIGATMLMTYNTKTRQLAIYYSDDGFQVKGSTLKNFDPEKSYSKTIRKPEEFLPNLNAIKASVKKLDGVKAVKKKLTGRINKDTILLKAF